MDPHSIKTTIQRNRIRKSETKFCVVTTTDNIKRQGEADLQLRYKVFYEHPLYRKHRTGLHEGAWPPWEGFQHSEPAAMWKEPH